LRARPIKITCLVQCQEKPRVSTKLKAIRKSARQQPNGRRNPEEDSGAGTNLDSFNAILKAQAAPTLPSELGSDLTSLIKDLTSGNASAAKADLSKVQAQASPMLPSDLGGDLTSLLKDLTSGNTSAAKADISKVQADLQTENASSVADA
jgi:hypothetical protein